MTLLMILLAIGILNAAVAFDQGILMLSDKRWRWEPEAWLEAVLYVILWPLQLTFWIGMRVWAAMDWCQAKIWGA